MRWFEPSEWQCKCGRPECDAPKDLDPTLADRADTLRTRFGHPLIVTSGIRCAYRNAAVGGAPDSAHLSAQALDLGCMDATLRRLLVGHAYDLFDYIEIAPHHVHVDVKPRGAQLLDVGNG